jgi:replication factor A1
MNSADKRRILIILDLEVIESLGELEKIGEPVALASASENPKPANTTIAGNGFYGNKPQQPAVQRETQQGLPSRNGQSSSAHANIYPIEALSPYGQKWTIKARVTSKSEIKTWAKGPNVGKLFSVNLLDESGEIKATGFNIQCDELYDKFQEGSVYYISTPCRVQIAKKQFSNVNNDYELTFERDTTVEKCEDQDDVPRIKYNFTNIGALQQIEKDSTIDVIGILKEYGDADQIISRATSKPYDKRELTLCDDSGYSVRLTVWGKTATTFEAQPESIIAFKGAKVSDFNGKSLSLLSSGSMNFDPDIPEAHKLKGWYDSQGRSETFQTYTNMGSAGAAGGNLNEVKTFAQVRDDNLGGGEKPEYFTSKATIRAVKQENIAYPACGNPIKDGKFCQKKAQDMDGSWSCEFCSITFPKPEYRWMMSMSAADHTGQLYLNCFNDVGNMIMNMKAEDYMALKEQNDEAATKAVEQANFKTFVFRCRAKKDTYQEIER